MPDFRGCIASEASEVLRRFKYEPVEVPDEATTGIEKSIVIRQTSSGRTVCGEQRVAIAYSGPSVLDNPPTTIVFDPEASEVTLIVKTLPGIPGDGDKRVVVRLGTIDGGAQIGEPASAVGRDCRCRCQNLRALCGSA